MIIYFEKGLIGVLFFATIDATLGFVETFVWESDSLWGKSVGL